MTTGEIRRAVYDRQRGECLDCGTFITFTQAHMHEKLARGKGGKISLDNSIILCSNCHIGRNGRHGNRHPHFKGGTMTYTCIGKRKGRHGEVFQCTNTSDRPSNSQHPEWGYLCPQCLGTQYGHATLHVDVADIDKPNDVELDPCEQQVPSPFEQSEQEEIDHLQELDLS